MVGVLNKIPVTQWIRGTIEKMNKAGKQDSQSWNDYWFETYKELGGQSEESGTKGCPKHAAYGLWRLGRIKETNIPYHHQAINSINQEYGKNAVYAILALDLWFFCKNCTLPFETQLSKHDKGRKPFLEPINKQPKRRAGLY